VLAVATILLVVLALQSVRPAPVDGSPVPTSTFTREPRPVSTGAASATPTSTPTAASPASYPREQERFFAIGSDGWWRATAGSCDGPAPLIEHSVDGGETWEDVTPTYRGIAEIATLNAFAGSEAEVVAGVGAACETQALRTFTQGEFWQPYDDVLAASRYTDPANPASVVTPGGAVAAPCAEPRSFRVAGGIVALVCDGRAFVLGDGATWQALQATDAVALTIAGDAVLTAERAADCEGVAVTRWTGDGFSTVDSLGCAAGVDPAAPLALADADGEALVWSGDALIPAS
jgi:hypothetical protein